MMKRLLSIFAILLLSICSIVKSHASTPATGQSEILIKSELASPIILENSQGKNYLKISLTGFPQEMAVRSPINLALVIDRSTSMSGDRIEKAREAAILAVNMLDSQDTLSIVAYDNDASVIIPATKVKNKPALIKAINQYIKPQGMTALFAGVSKGLEQVSKNLQREQVNRIILLSDGQANVGPTSINELSELARKAAKKGIAVTTIGLGNGYNEDLMTAIAGYSDGNHAFVANSADLEKAFNSEFKDVMSVIAQDVEITITLDNATKPVRLLGRDGTISNKTVKVKLNQLYANQEKYILLEVIPPKGSNNEEKRLADVSVSYNNLATKQQNKFNDSISVRYSKSTDEVKSAILEEVMIDSAIQQAAIANDEAIRLLDAGKVEEAQQVVHKNSEMLNSLAKPTSEKAQMKLNKSVEENTSLSSTMDSKDINYSRKAIKEQTYNTKKQK